MNVVLILWTLQMPPEPGVGAEDGERRDLVLLGRRPVRVLRVEIMAGVGGQQWEREGRQETGLVLTVTVRILFM